jgi:hypothetical protein
MSVIFEFWGIVCYNGDLGILGYFRKILIILVSFRDFSCFEKSYVFNGKFGDFGDFGDFRDFEVVKSLPKKSKLTILVIFRVFEPA